MKAPAPQRHPGSRNRTSEGGRYKGKNNALGARLFVEEFFDASYVFGNVHADSVVLDFGDADFPTVFQPTELLELFNFFQFALGQGGIFEQGLALENIKSEVLPIFHVDFLLGVANPGDRCA